MQSYLDKMLYDITNNRLFNAKVELDNTPHVKSGDTRKIKLTFKNANNIFEPKN